MRHRLLRTSLLLPGLLLVALLSGCERGQDEPEPPPETSSRESLGQVDPEQQQATDNAWHLGEVWLEAARTECAALHTTLAAFLDRPEQPLLEAAREHWHQCHSQWHHLDPLLALSDSNPGLFGELERMAFNIDARPLQPGYLDSLEHYPHSGIVNDITLDIEAETLRAQHGLTDATDVSLGLHAIEFLLWGERGERPASDYQPQTRVDAPASGPEVSEDQRPDNRRRELVLLLSHLLQDDLQAMYNHWRSETGRLRHTYQQLQPTSRLQLLKDAARELLEQQLVTDLQSLADPELAHNRFAGQSLRPAVSALKGLEALLAEGEPPLSRWLGEAEATAQWHRQLEEIITRLEAEIEGARDANTEVVIPQLQLLATFLQPVDASAGD